MILTFSSGTSTVKVLSSSASQVQSSPSPAPPPTFQGPWLILTILSIFHVSSFTFYSPDRHMAYFCKLLYEENITGLLRTTTYLANKAATLGPNMHCGLL